jgi:hypothetical protein
VYLKFYFHGTESHTITVRTTKTLAIYLEELKVLLLEPGEDAVVPHHLHLEEHGALAQQRLRWLAEAGEGLRYPDPQENYPFNFQVV